MEAVVHITGYAGTEIETRANGTVAKFRLACTPRVRTKGEWGDGNTTWIEVSCFRALAEHVASSIRKGDPVVVIGRLRTNAWEKDGQSATGPACVHRPGDRRTRRRAGEGRARALRSRATGAGARPRLTAAAAGCPQEN